MEANRSGSMNVVAQLKPFISPIVPSLFRIHNFFAVRAVACVGVKKDFFSQISIELFLFGFSLFFFAATN